ncbi:MAG: hypothetical protein ABIS45_10155 [Burkholderiales bacterium]
MSSRSRCSALVALVAALAGCAPDAVKPDTIAAAPDPGRAVIIGWGNSPLEDARAALLPQQGTRVTRLFVASTNGRKTSFGENVVRVAPGDTELIIACGIYVGYRFFSYDGALRATLDANRVYRLRANPAGRRCEPALDDVTGKSG